MWPEDWLTVGHPGLEASASSGQYLRTSAGCISLSALFGVVDVRKNGFLGMRGYFSTNFYAAIHFSLIFYTQIKSTNVQKSIVFVSNKSNQVSIAGINFSE